MKYPIKLLFLLSTIILLPSCTTSPSIRAQAVSEADSYTIRNCRYLGEVEGSSSHAGIASSYIGIPNAKNEAKDKAAALGATHIMWGTIEPNYWVSVKGKAYKCHINDY